MGRLDALDLDRRLAKDERHRRLEAAQRRLAQLRLVLGGRTGPPDADGQRPLGPPLLVALEGWDAAGKGGAIKRLTAPLDPRHHRVVQYAAPTPDELRHHWLHRFWVPLPGRGGMAVYDRTWYGRVLVERVEGLTPEPVWRRAYREIREFERLLHDDGTILVKLFLHISDAEQLARFERRRDDPLKAWKLTDEDWRNRSRRPAYTEAIEELLAETDTGHAPWDLVPADSKPWARVAVIETVIRRIEERCAAQGFGLPDPVEGRRPAD